MTITNEFGIHLAFPKKWLIYILSNYLFILKAFRFLYKLLKQRVLYDCFVLSLPFPLSGARGQTYGFLCCVYKVHALPLSYAFLVFN